MAGAADSVGFGPPAQIAYAVPDAIEAAERWARETGAGPFLVRRHIELVDVVYRGREATFDHTSAYGQWGSVMVELVQDHGVGPSIVRDLYGPGASGLHHVAVLVDDLAASLERAVALGYEIAMSARTPGGVDFHFVDATDTHGHMFELYESSERLLDFYAMVAEAARCWDGSAPVRML